MTPKRFFYLAIVPGLFIQFVGALFYFVLLDQSYFAQIIYFATKVALVIWPLFWLRESKKYFSPTQKPIYKKSVLVGIGSGILFAQIIIFVFLFYRDYFANFAPLLLHKAQSLKILDYYVLFSVFLSIFHSLLEEYYWRWFIFRGLSIKFSMIKASAIASIAFAGHHYIILSQFFPVWSTVILGTCVGLTGFMWCLFYAKTHTLLTTWISHIFVDVAVMGIGYYLLF